MHTAATISWGRRAAAAVALAALIACPFAARAAGPIVSLEVATAEGFDPTDAREWSQMLAAAGFANVRLRGATKADAPKLETRGAGALQTHHVVGVLTDGGQLILPAGKFRLADRGPVRVDLIYYEHDLPGPGEEGAVARERKDLVFYTYPEP